MRGMLSNAPVSSRFPLDAHEALAFVAVVPTWATMCSFPELGVSFAADALVKHGRPALESWLTATFADRGLRFSPGDRVELGREMRRYEKLAAKDTELAARGPHRHADLDSSGLFHVGHCGCGWRGILDVRDVVVTLFEAHEIKRVRFGNPWFDSFAAPRSVALAELPSLTYRDLDQRLVEVRRSSGDPRPTRRLRDLA